MFNITCIECQICRTRNYINENLYPAMLQECINCNNVLITGIEMWNAQVKNAEFIDINEFYLKLK